MASVKNTLGIQVGDQYTFTNKMGHKVVRTVTRISDSSFWNENGHRQSFGTLAGYAKRPDFEIIKAN